MSALWGGRFEGDLDPLFEAFNASLPEDRRLLPQDVAGSRAWARALGRAGVLAPDEVERLDTALRDIDAEFGADPTALDAQAAEDVHSFVEAELVRRVGELGKKLHTGRSRNDQVATDFKLHLKERLPALDAALVELSLALVDLAESTPDLAIPGYTHLQRAQPITVGHHALAYVEMLARDRERLRDAGRRLDRCPLGSGALAGTSWPIDREVLASELGFEDGPTHNSLDAVSDRDHLLELAFVASVVMVHLSRLAEDWIFFATSEAGFLELADAVSTGSSLMPQKKNPDSLELVRGKAGRVIGDLQALLVTSKGLPLAYDKDLQEDKRPLFDALDTAEGALRVTAVVVRGARFDRERCAAACEHGFLDATDLADLLVRAGIPFRDAHERVGEAVREALDAGVELRQLPEERQRALFPELKQDLDQALRVAAMLERRSVVGGTSPERVREEAALWRDRLVK